MLSIFSRYASPITRRMATATQAAAPKLLHRFSKPLRSTLTSQSSSKPTRVPVRHLPAYQSEHKSSPLLQLLATPHLEPLTGPSVLHSLIRRHFKTLATEHNPETIVSNTPVETPAKIQPRPIIETYKSVMKSLKPRFEKLGFKESDGSNELKLFNGKYRICIYNQERFDDRYLSISFVDAHYERSDRTVMNILAPTRWIENNLAHKKLAQKYLEPSEKFEKELIELQLGQLIEFVEKYDKQIAAL